jgi:hypothetical protein
LHLASPPPPLPGADERNLQLIHRCLEKDPEKRFETARALLEALDDPSGQLMAPQEVDAEVEVEAMWTEALEQTRDGEFGRVNELCRRILQRCPDHVHAKELLEEIDRRDKQAEQIYATLEHGMTTCGLEELGTLLEEAVALYPDHPSGRVPQVKLGIRARHYRQAMEDGVDAVRRGNWQLARCCIEQALRANSHSLSAKGAAHFVTTVQQRLIDDRQHIDHAIATGDYEGAVGLARATDEHIEALISAVCRGEGDERQ